MKYMVNNIGQVGREELLFGSGRLWDRACQEELTVHMGKGESGLRALFYSHPLGGSIRFEYSVWPYKSTFQQKHLKQPKGSIFTTYIDFMPLQFRYVPSNQNQW